MPDYSITLTETQDEALLSLLEKERETAQDQDLTATAMLHRLVSGRLASAELEIVTQKHALREAAARLSPYIRDKMAAGLNPEQLERLKDVLGDTTRDRESESRAQG